MKRPHDMQLNASFREKDRYYWLVLGPASVAELAEVTKEACLEILAHAYRQLLRYVVFAYREPEGAKRPVFLIFNYRVGVWYPFLPIPESGDMEPAQPDASGVLRVARDVEREGQLQAKLADILPIVHLPEDWFQFRNAPI